MQSSEGRSTADGEKIAVMYKFYRQRFQPNRTAMLPMRRISARGMYREHQKAFDGLAAAFAKSGADPEPYVKFFAVDMCKAATEIDEWLASPISIQKYIDWMSTVRKYDSIILAWDTTVASVVDFCRENGVGAEDGFRLMVRRGMLANLLLGGKVSEYWLAAIPGFDKVIPRLDYFTRLELTGLGSRFDVYSTDVNRAMLYKRRRKAMPIKDVNDALRAAWDENPKRVK